MKGTKGIFEYTVRLASGKVKTIVTPERTDALESRTKMMNEYGGCTCKVIALSCCPQIVGKGRVPQGMVIG